MYFQPVLTKCKSPNNRPDQTQPTAVKKRDNPVWNCHLGHASMTHKIFGFRTGPDTKINDENYNQFCWYIIIFYSNQQLSKNVPSPYEIGTCSYDPYTKINDENYNQFCWYIIIFYSNQQLSKNVVWNWDMLVWPIYHSNQFTFKYKPPPLKLWGQ